MLSTKLSAELARARRQWALIQIEEFFLNGPLEVLKALQKYHEEVELICEQIPDMEQRCAFRGRARGLISNYQWDAPCTPTVSGSLVASKSM